MPNIVTALLAPFRGIVPALLVLSAAGTPHEVAAQSRAPRAAPATVVVRGDILAETRTRIIANDAALSVAWSGLRQAANDQRNTGPWSVTAKTLLPPSGDKRDYQSFGPYWWPDSTKPNGLPYIQRDGLMNPVMRKESDAPRLYSMVDAVEKLALAYQFSGEPAYAERAALVLRTFFLDSLTGMRPHLRYGQAIPGVTPGRGIGLIDTRDLGRVVDAIAMLRGAPAWTPGDDAGMTQWARAFLAWMLTSPEGNDERRAKNNHGMWYDAQVVALALFVGDTSRARTVLTQWTPSRLGTQLATDGSQPDELARTRPLHYSVFNLDAMTRLADMGRPLGIDLWRWRGDNGASLRKAVGFVAPYLAPGVAFAKADITPVDPLDLIRVVRRAAFALNDSTLWRLLESAPPALRDADPSALLYPRNSAVQQRTWRPSPPPRQPMPAWMDGALAASLVKLAATADGRSPNDGWPRHTDAAGRWVVRPARQWISGFFPGALWYAYALTGDSTWRTRAVRWTAGLEPMSRVTNTHDLGFVLFDSFGAAVRTTGDTAARTVLLRGAATLRKRFSPTVGAIKSWDVDSVSDGRRGWSYPVIVDNLMNLELLYWAAEARTDSTLAALATRHALTSMAAHLRPNGSTSHVALFDPSTGALLRTVTWQGAADTSVWARGQGWAVHGLTAAYRESKRPELLAGAERAADWWLSHHRLGRLPPWDFQAPAATAQVPDASAAAICASGLYELSAFVSPAKRAAYIAYADSMMADIWRFAGSKSSTGEAILAHSTGGLPQGAEIDVSLAYADYYFLEAISRRRRVAELSR